MIRLYSIVFALLAVTAIGANVSAAPRNGEVETRAGKLQAYNADAKQWTSLDDFWLAYAARRGGLTWPLSRVYPNYNQVREHDTFLVKLDSGTCLMEFFHTRWRRANDVHRWDDAFNKHSACPDVFK